MKVSEKRGNLRYQITDLKLHLLQDVESLERMLAGLEASTDEELAPASTGFAEQLKFHAAGQNLHMIAQRAMVTALLEADDCKLLRQWQIKDGAKDGETVASYDTSDEARACLILHPTSCFVEARW